MCIAHGTVVGRDNGYEKEDKPKKHIQRVSEKEFEKGDPNFIDERRTAYKPKKKESFLSSLFE